jgi:hypothetical protein
MTDPATFVGERQNRESIESSCSGTLSKFDVSQCKKWMSIPSFGFVQKKIGNAPSLSTEKLLNDAISVYSSDDEDDIEGTEKVTSEKSGRMRKVRRRKSRYDAKHKHRSLKGKERQVSEDKFSFLSGEVFELKLPDGSPINQFQQDTENGRRRKRERAESDRHIKTTIKTLSEEVQMREKDVLLRACKLMLTCKQQQKQQDF